MNRKINIAVKRLETILPLLSGFQSLNSKDAELYCRLLNGFVEQGVALTLDEMSDIVENTALSLANLEQSKLIVLDLEGRPNGAYPFTSQVREHKVNIDGISVFCMCALDALSVSAMFNRPTIIDSKCRVTGEAIHIEQCGSIFSDGALEVWFGINWGASVEDAVCAESLCMEMMFLVNSKTAEQWLSESRATREIFDLRSAAEFSAAFFVPLAQKCCCY